MTPREPTRSNRSLLPFQASCLTGSQVRFVELQLLKSFYSHGFCSKGSITKTEDEGVSLTTGWQLSPLPVKGWRRPLHAEERISKPSLPEDREHTTEPATSCQRNRGQGVPKNKQ